MRVIHVLRKPLEKPNVAENVLEHGCGALHIDAVRIQTNWDQESSVRRGHAGKPTWSDGVTGWGSGSMHAEPHDGGRWPANLILEHKPGCRCVGTRRVPTGVAVNRHKDGTTPRGMWGFTGKPGPDQTFGDGNGMETVTAWDCTPDCPVPNLDTYDDRGGASRFYFRVHEADE